MLPTVVLFGLAAQLFLGLSMATDPYTPGGKGNAVVTEVVRRINSLLVFPDDHKFLCRVAWVESKYGEDPGTYRPGYYAGIWQVDYNTFRKTLQQSLYKYWYVIWTHSGIDWRDTKWQDLEKPVYSGMAARLFLATIPEPIPKDLPSQAQYWKKYYNTSAGKGTVQKFIDDVKHATGCAVDSK